MQCVASGVCRHYLVIQISLHNVSNWRTHGNYGKLVNQGQPIRDSIRRPAGKFVQHRGTCHQLITVRGDCPPLPGPLASSNYCWGGAHFVIETRNRCLDIGSGLSHLPILSQAIECFQASVLEALFVDWRLFFSVGVRLKPSPPTPSASTNTPSTPLPSTPVPVCSRTHSAQPAAATSKSTQRGRRS
jgi:hypothetical protein